MTLFITTMAIEILEWLGKRYAERCDFEASRDFFQVCFSDVVCFYLMTAVLVDYDAP